MTISDLKEIRISHSKIRSLNMRIDRLKTAMYSPSAPVLSHTPKGSAMSDPTANAAVTITEMTLHLLEMIIDLEQKIEAAEQYVSRMPYDLQKVIRERYINGLSWREVAKACDLTEEGCYKRHKKAKAYLKRVQ